MWEVRSTYDICADIAGHLGVRERFTEGRTQAEWMAKHYGQVKEKRSYLPEWEVAMNMGLSISKVLVMRTVLSLLISAMIRLPVH